MIEATHLTKRFGPKTAVGDLSSRWRPVRWPGFSGPTGLAAALFVSEATVKSHFAGSSASWDCETGRRPLCSPTRQGWCGHNAPAAPAR